MFEEARHEVELVRRYVVDLNDLNDGGLFFAFVQLIVCVMPRSFSFCRISEQDAETQLTCACRCVYEWDPNQFYGGVLVPAADRLFW